MKVLRKFVQHISDLEEASRHEKILVYRIAWNPDIGYEWSTNPAGRPLRPLASVTIPQADKTGLVQDIEAYLAKGTEKWYQDKGIPWRRGYMLYGPPGTGKTSLAQAIATRFNLPIYMISLTQPGLDDQGLSDLFDNMSSTSLVLLEDIDSSGIQRENMRSKKKKASKNDSEGARITLSGLLNCIDGPCSKNGRVLFISSNDSDSLDPALKPPGRIDKPIFLGNATTEVLVEMFSHIFISEAVASSDPFLDVQRLEGLAQAFGFVVPSGNLSPAEVQGYQMLHRSDPLRAAWEAGHWAIELMETKARGANVSAHSGDVLTTGNPEPSSVESLGASNDGSTSRADC